MKNILIAAALLACSGAHAERATPTTVDAALVRAQQEHLPVLIDFTALWCYSCYYMETHVLTGPEWTSLDKHAVVVKTDADSPEGAQWMEKLRVKALPSYVVLKPDGSELGRVVAEQSRQKFYAQMQRILGGDDALDALKKKVDAGSTISIAEVMSGYLARDQVQPGLDWYAALPGERRKTASADADVTLWLNRLQMEKAAKDLDFMEAARLRDEMFMMQKKLEEMKK